ncbi:helix-turn-helix domain-containing protein [Saccharopolyspora indica]|uniref:helix-turn-helix domain-containing protein n=1 Tax=Saccharopolyspora indica TaxID=1229659 RepID=UPI0022EA9E12|nr:helix-turn-helix domain-containing protein [Saccharopolyspora indica]MDA3646301.1 helix-turn-helix domain-containing protein [Saccharopolyspora indica]
MAEVIGKRLREIRRARGKSLTVIAGLAGISTSYLSRLARITRSSVCLSGKVFAATATTVRACAERQR